MATNKRRRTANRDPSFRPGPGGDSDDDDEDMSESDERGGRRRVRRAGRGRVSETVRTSDLRAATLAPEPAAAIGRRRPNNPDPSYRPGREVEEEEEEDEME